MRQYGGAEFISASLSFADREIDPEAENGKASALDILCMTNDETQVNIEVQVQKRQNMGQRSLYYWENSIRAPLDGGRITITCGAL